MVTGEITVGFEDLPVTVPPLQEYAGPGGGVYYNGSDGAGGFTSEGAFLKNTFTDFGGGFTGWTGWSYSTTSDTETAGFGNQYSSYVGVAAEGSAYAVAYAPAGIELPVGAKSPISISVSNTTYAALSMRDGDDFAKKFGDGDYFKLTLSGYGASGQILGSVEVYLADYREETDPKGIVQGWNEVSLLELAGGTGHLVYEIGFSLDSTDSAPWGINTPSYVAIDQLVLGETPAWGGFDIEPDGWVNTGDFLGWVYPVGDYAYVALLRKWTYLPVGEQESSSGAWAYLPN
nr:DUF4465 domain-containing protein [Oceanipulchritudo coccoides]